MENLLSQGFFVNYLIFYKKKKKFSHAGTNKPVITLQAAISLYFDKDTSAFIE